MAASFQKVGVLLCFVLLFCGFNSTYASSPRISLEDLIKNTLSKSGQIKEAEYDLEVARQQLERANAAMFPTGSVLILAAPIFEERGNALNSTSNWSKWGPFVSTSAQLIQPLYTFGQISNYQKAAENQITAKEGLVEMKRQETIQKVKEFYYGYLMAGSMETLVDDLIDFLEEAVTTAEKNLKKKSSNIKPHDLYNLKTNLDDLRQKRLLAVQSKKTAEKAVQWITASDFETLGKSKLEPEEFEKKSQEQYLNIARANRPEFRALSAGQQAYQALADAKRAQSYPAIFVGGYVSYAWSPVREKQPSIFANDPFNRLQGGIGLGLKLDLEFTRHAAESAEQIAEAMKLKAKEMYAAPGIELEVKKTFWELEQSVEGLEIAERRKKTARQWFVSNAMGWNIGVVNSKDLMESLEGNGMARKNHIETVYAYNMALANLSKAVGREVTKRNPRDRP